MLLMKRSYIKQIPNLHFKKRGVILVIKFDCKHYFEWTDSEKRWQCAISRLIYFGSHLEFTVQTTEPATVIVGKTSSGFFVFFKSDYTGVDLTSLFNIDRNIPQLSSVCFDEEKAVTIAFAIKRIGHLLSSPGRMRKHNQINKDYTLDEGETPF